MNKDGYNTGGEEHKLEAYLFGRDDNKHIYMISTENNDKFKINDHIIFKSTCNDTNLCESAKLILYDPLDHPFSKFILGTENNKKNHSNF